MSSPVAATTPTPPPDGTLIVHGEAAAAPKRKRIKILDRTPSPVILDDYGEIEPARCTVGGPGVAGGIVGVATQVTVRARDANGIGIREGGQTFKLTLQHSSTGSKAREYESVDRGDGLYVFQGIRSDLKGMHKVRLTLHSRFYAGAATERDSPCTLQLVSKFSCTRALCDASMRCA